MFFNIDLSLPQATGNLSLPAIIVTPPSPVLSHNFFIAFLPKPSLRERIVSWTWRHFGGSLLLRIRFILIVLFIVFALIYHLAAERLAVRRPYLEFNPQTSDHALVLDSPMGSLNFGSFLTEKHASSRADPHPPTPDGQIKSRKISIVRGSWLPTSIQSANDF